MTNVPLTIDSNANTQNTNTQLLPSNNNNYNTITNPVEGPSGLVVSPSGIQLTSRYVLISGRSDSDDTAVSGVDV